jgi:hypothetical protein
VQYVQDVRRLWLLARRYGFDALMLVAVDSTLEVVLRHGSPQAPRTPLWLAAPATAFIALPVLWRRRLPFAAPLGYGSYVRRSRSSKGLWRV